MVSVKGNRFFSKTTEKITMVIESVKFINVGPFSRSDELSMEDDVTILTGPNDVGKSSVLEILDHVCSGDPIRESLVNVDHLAGRGNDWKEGDDIGCQVRVRVTDDTISDGLLEGGFKNGDRVSIFLPLNGKSKPVKIPKAERGKQKVNANGRLKALPAALRLNGLPDVGARIDVNQPNPTEAALLRLGFGQDFSLEAFLGWSESTRITQIARATRRLNEKLSVLLSGTSSLEFVFREVGPDGDRLSVSLYDKARGLVPPESRGAGARKMVALMTQLLAAGHLPTIILLDEPENSLHADSQHNLRRLLERLGKESRIQVVYATHSPAMINNLHPKRIRVLVRDDTGLHATTVFSKKRPDGNFSTVRASLGMVPSDSLLYADVTLVTEGASEIRALPALLVKLEQARVEGFEDASRVLAECHIIDGGGDSFEYYVRLAQSQGSCPVLFLDGDKVGRAKEVRRKHRDVAVIELDKGTEIENLFPPETYIAAVKSTLNDPPDEITVEDYQEWLSGEGNNLPDQMLLSKKVERWLESKGQLLRKPEAVVKAVESLEDIQKLSEEGRTKLRELLAAMRTGLENRR